MLAANPVTLALTAISVKARKCFFRFPSTPHCKTCLSHTVGIQKILLESVIFHWEILRIL